MNRMRFKRFMSLALCICLIMTLLTGFTTRRGFGNIYVESSWDIYDGATYTKYQGEHSTNGIECAHIVTADIKDSDLIPVVLSGEVYGAGTVGSFITYIENQGYKVVAAINGDIFDTSSGTPKNLMIHNGNIICGGYQSDRVIAFDDKNKASLETAKLNYSASCTIEYQMPVVSTASITVPKTREITTTHEAISEDGTVTVVEETVTEEYTETQDISETVYKTVTEDTNLSIGFFNVPHGSAKALHLYNRHYSSSTHTKGVNAEAVIVAEDIQLGVNKTIKGTVKSVSASTANTAIGDNELVLSTEQGSATYDFVSALKVGSQIEIKVEDPENTNLKNAKEALGIYYSLVENGKNVTVGSTINPRTVLGVKKDGSIVLGEIDGRQSSISKGLGLSDTADMLVDMGLETAVNLDGGGSSVMYVRLAGKWDKASRVSSPSEGTERKVANCLVLLYKNKPNTSPKHLHIDVSSNLLMPGATIELTPYASNENYEKVSAAAGVSYGLRSGGGILIGSQYTAGSSAGEVTIEGRAGSVKGTKNVTVVDDIIIKPSVSKLNLNGGDVKDINLSCYYGSNSVNFPVASDDKLFSWSCDESIGTITEEGVFTANTSMSALSGNITAVFRDKQVVIPVNIGASLVTFSDTENHWAKEYIGTLAGYGYLSGMGDNKFEPDSELTRAQFVTMIAKIDGADIKGLGVNTSEFTDISATDWFYDYIGWGLEKSIVSGMGWGNFAPNAPITREQMAVILCKYAISTEFMLPQVNEIPNFVDAGSISSWATDYVYTAAGAGILSGFETGEFKPQGNATRAQAAKMIYVLCSLKGII